MDEFGSLLKQRRIARGLTQASLSDLLWKKGIFVHNSLLSRWEHNERRPSAGQRKALLAIGDVLSMRDDEKSDLLVKAGLAPIQPEEIDVEAMLESLPKTWQKVAFLRNDLLRMSES